MGYLRLIKSAFVFLNTLRFLVVNRDDGKDAVERIQLKKLRGELQWAWDNIPFYRSFWAKNGFNPYEDFQRLEDIQKVPYTDKETVRNHLSEMLPGNINAGSLSLVNTGGTTGMPMKFYIDNYVARAKEVAYQVFVDYNYFGYRLWLDRVVIMRGYKFPQSMTDNGVYWRRDIKENALLMSSFHIKRDTYRSYLDKISQFKPRFIRAYPSAIVSLCKYMKEDGISPIKGLRGVICSSETIYEWQRTLVRDVLGVEIYSFYGHSEKSVVAYQTNSSKLHHFNPFYGYTEFINSSDKHCAEDGELGEVVVTSLDNRYFPFIRYRTSDMVKNTTEASPCRLWGLVAKEIVGRKQEYVYDKNGEASLFLWSDEVFWGIEGIEAYQYVQDEYGKLTLLVQSEKPLSAGLRKEIHEKAQIIFQGFDIEIEQTSHIALTKSGKFRYLVQNIR